MMRIALLPAASEDTASSRIRVHSFRRALQSLGHDARLGFFDDAEVIFVQKKANEETVARVRRAKESGRKVFYDIDDLGDALWYWVHPWHCYQMMGLADAVTTDTEGHLDLLRRRYAAPRVEIIPDSIDYDPASPQRPTVKSGVLLRVLWFGSVGNITLFERYASALNRLRDVQVVVATGRDSIESLSGKHPSIELVPWSREDFIPLLQSCDLSCLMHDGNTNDRAKSNNKMIASITWGVPAIVSRTPEYERTAREAGVPEAVFSNEAELARAIERFRSVESRAAYLDRAQPVIWHRYSPESIAKGFLRMVQADAGTVPRTEALGSRLLGRPAFQREADRWTPVAFNAWRFRNSDNRIALVRDMGVKALGLLTPSAEPLPAGGPSGVGRGTVERDYRRDWVNPEGAAYRMGVYERQRKGGEKPLVENPSADDVRSALKAHGARSVLEVGCGWGRLLEEISPEFEAEGCDVSDDMLRLCAKGLKTFHHDITVENIPFLRANAGRWDAIFTRGVMLYFMEFPVQMAYAMNNMMMLSAKKILIWEWPEVCDRMRDFSDSPKFEYHPLERRSE